MEFSSKTRDAIDLMVYLAMHTDSGAIGFSEILDRLEINAERLRKLMWRLWSHDLLHLQFGDEYALRLPRLPEDIDLAQIIVAAEEPDADAANTGCPTSRDAIYRLQQILHDYLEGIDLSQIIERRIVRIDAVTV